MRGGVHRFREHGTAVEINSRPNAETHRYLLHLAAYSIDNDAHAPGQLGFWRRLGVEVPADRNTWPADYLGVDRVALACCSEHRGTSGKRHVSIGATHLPCYDRTPLPTRAASVDCDRPPDLRRSAYAFGTEYRPSTPTECA